MKACVIFNPTARGDKARALKARLVEIAGEAALQPTTGPGSARQLAAEAVQQGFETIVAGGGDGTLNEVLNGIAAAPDGLARARLGILPLGTTNVFAKELLIPQDIRAAWDVIRRGTETQIDLPYSAWTVDGSAQRRYFAQMAGAGLDSRAIELVDWQLKKRLGWLAYIVAGLGALRAPMAPISVVANGAEFTGQLVLIGNGKFYGGRFNMFPAADLRDGVLEVVIYRHVNARTALRALRGMLTGDFHSGTGTIQLQAAAVSLQAASRLCFHVDGENVAPLPASFGMEPRALRVIVP